MNILGQKLRDTGDSVFYGQIKIAGENSELVVQGLDVAEELVQQKKTNISDEQRITNLENTVNELKQILLTLTTDNGL